FQKDSWWKGWRQAGSFRKPAGCAGAPAAPPCGSGAPACPPVPSPPPVPSAPPLPGRRPPEPPEPGPPPAPSSSLPESLQATTHPAPPRSTSIPLRVVFMEYLPGAQGTWRAGGLKDMGGAAFPRTRAVLRALVLRTRLAGSLSGALARAPAYSRPHRGERQRLRRGTPDSAKTSLDVEQLVEVALREVFGAAGVLFHHGGDEVFLLLLELEDLLFDRASRDQAIHADDLLLADAVRAVRRLIFDGRVPPRVEVNHGVGRGQVEA